MKLWRKLKGWHLALQLSHVIEMSIPHGECLTPNSWLHSCCPLPANAYPGRRPVMTIVPRSLLAMWETWIEFPDPGHLQSTAKDRSFLYVCLSLQQFLSNQQNICSKWHGSFQIMRGMRVCDANIFMTNQRNWQFPYVAFASLSYPWALSVMKVLEKYSRIFWNTKQNFSLWSYEQLHVQLKCFSIIIRYKFSQTY